MSSDESQRREREPSTGLKIAFGVLALLVAAYSLLIATRPLLGMIFVVWLFAVYLLWRFFLLSAQFVRAVERIADAMERPRSDEMERQKSDSGDIGGGPENERDPEREI